MVSGKIAVLIPDAQAPRIPIPFRTVIRFLCQDGGGAGSVSREGLARNPKSTIFFVGW